MSSKRPTAGSLGSAATGAGTATGAGGAGDEPVGPISVPDALGVTMAATLPSGAGPAPDGDARSPAGLPPDTLPDAVPPASAAPSVSAAPAPANPAVPPAPTGLRRPSGSLTLLENLPKGATIGRYLVVRRLGAGGMGVVYAAYDPELDRRVAIKLLRASAVSLPGLDPTIAGQARTRFLREAQAMARLSHPNVISVFDVGTFEGQVFIAMEFVDGTTLTDWLTEKPRTQREIVDQFILAGRGLAAAHAAGLVHRDFKPDNVLIGRDGCVRVMDFGLARSAETIGTSGERRAVLVKSGNRSLRDQLEALGVELGEAANQPLRTALTQAGALMGTPGYMAPEQFLGESTDARTDEFSFCVSLFEALHGAPPFPGETMAARCLSVVQGRMTLLPAEVQRKVPGWLRQVLLRGLATDPAQRYPTMDALLHDLGRDVRAIRRRWALGFGLGVCALLVGAAYAQIVKRTHTAATCQGASARLVGVWDQERKQAAHTALLSTGRPYAADVWLRVEHHIDRYTQAWRDAHTEACQATFVRGEQSPRLLDLRMRCLDRRLDEVAAFVALLEKATDKADDATVEQAALASQELAPVSACADVDALSAPVPLPEHPQARARVKDLQKRFAELRALERVGRYGEVAAGARKAAESAEQVGHAPTTAEALLLLGDVQTAAAEYRAAEQDLFRAVAAGVAGRHHRAVAEAWISLMFVAGAQRKYAEAQQWEALARAELVGLTSADLTARLLNNLCVVKLKQQQYDAALAACNEALSQTRQARGADHPSVAAILSNLALVYRRRNQTEQALALSRESLALEQKQLGPQHPRVGLSLYNLALTYRDTDQFDEAEKLLKQAVDIYEHSLGRVHPRLLTAKSALATTYSYWKRHKEAIQVSREVLATQEEIARADDNQVAQARVSLGRILLRAGRFAEAIGYFDRALVIYESKNNTEQIASVLVSRALALTALDRAPETTAQLARAAALLGDGGDPSLRGDVAAAQARALWAQKTRRNAAQIERDTKALVRRARTLYTQAGQRSKRDAAELENWLSDAEIDVD